MTKASLIEAFFMKLALQRAVLLISTTFFAQKKVLKTVQTNASSINIQTEGLDTIVLENAEGNLLEVWLYAEEYDHQIISIDTKPSEVNIGFEFEGFETREVIFRKYITKGLQRAYAVVKIPADRRVTIYGTNVDIDSKNLKDDLNIYIDNGIIKLNSIFANTSVKFYSGNIYATVNNTNLEILSAEGNINWNTKEYKKEIKRFSKDNKKGLHIETVKANVFLTSR